MVVHWGGVQLSLFKLKACKKANTVLYLLDSGSQVLNKQFSEVVESLELLSHSLLQSLQILSGLLSPVLHHPVKHTHTTRSVILHYHITAFHMLADIGD